MDDINTLLEWMDLVFHLESEEIAEGAVPEEHDEHHFALSRAFRYSLVAAVFRLMLSFDSIETLHRQTFGLTGSKRTAAVSPLVLLLFFSLSLTFPKG